MFRLSRAQDSGISRRDVLRLLAWGAVGLVGVACGSRQSDEKARPSQPSGPAQGSSGAAQGGLGAAQGTVDLSQRFAAYQPADEPNGDLSKVVWPAFVTRAGPDVQRLYEFQIVNGDLMRYMPCFCGCGQEAGHRSNRDCYVRAVNPDGTVVLDPMAPT